MSRAWILQADPRLYDITGAVAELDVIWWYVPASAGELRTGDPVVVWRSGDTAGVVGMGVVSSRPRVHPIPTIEHPFVLDGTEEGASTRRVRFDVRATPYFPGDLVAAHIPGHAVLSDATRTVFPLLSDEWEALRPLLSESSAEQFAPPHQRHHEPSGTDGAVADDGWSRTSDLAGAVIDAIRDRSAALGALTARDVYVLVADRDTSQAEVEDLLDGLASPLVGAVSGSPEVGYLVTTPRTVVAARLRNLAARVAGEA